MRKEPSSKIFENKILKRIFGPKRDQNGEWTKFHNEVLRDLNRSPNTFGLIKVKRLRWAGHVVKMKGIRNVFKTLMKSPQAKDHKEV